MAIISMNDDHVCNEAGRIKQIAAELSELRRGAGVLSGEINNYWEGAAAGEFTALAERWLQDTKTAENEVAAIAALIRAAADEIREAETCAAKAIRIAGGVQSE